MIIFVPPFAGFPFVPAIDAWQRVRVWSVTSANLDIDTLPGLNLVAVARRIGIRPRLHMTCRPPANGSQVMNGTSYEAGARSEEHTSELQSLMRISYAVFCLKKKKHQK